MKRSKRLLAGLMALTIAFGATACSKDDNKKKYEDQVKVEDTDLIEAIPEGAESTISWMGTYDLNPKEGEEKSVAMNLFEKKGGKVNYQRVSDSNKHEKLAQAILANKDVPDIFKYEWLAFPADVSMGKFQSVDEIVDFESDLWSGTKATADQFVASGKHYVAPISFSVGTLMMYDQDVIEAEGLEDPYALYTKGEWNWTNWESIMREYVKNSSTDLQRYGVTGWYATQIIQQTGKTMVTNNDGVFSSNLNDPDIARAEGFLYDLAKDNLVFTEWVGSAKDCFSKKNILFYSMGTWAMTGTAGPQEGDNWSVVPIPTDPNSSGKYMTSDMTAYMWVKGSTKNEAVKCWYECSRVADTDPQYMENGKEKFFVTNPYWNDQMYQVFVDASSEEYTQVFDFSYAISNKFSDDNSQADAGTGAPARNLYEFVTKPDSEGTQKTWTQVKAEYSSLLEDELAKVNAAIAKIK